MEVEQEIMKETGFFFLENNLKNFFNNYKILYKWTAEDCISIDKIPYIGKYSNFLSNMYVATGFKKWGMTTSNVAANIITDKILNEKNKYSILFNSTRVEPLKNKDEMKNMLKETYDNLIKSRIIKNEKTKYCSHVGCMVKFNDVTKTWDCPCHGSRFNEDGTLIDGPSQKNLKSD